MLFYGYVDNGEKFIKVKITADTSAEAYRKLERFSVTVEEKFEEYRGRVECLMLRDENDKEICQSGEDVDMRTEAFDNKLKQSLENVISNAASKSEETNINNSLKDNYSEHVKG